MQVGIRIPCKQPIRILLPVPVSHGTLKLRCHRSLLELGYRGSRPGARRTTEETEVRLAYTDIAATKQNDENISTSCPSSEEHSLEHSDTWLGRCRRSLEQLDHQLDIAMVPSRLRKEPAEASRQRYTTATTHRIKQGVRRLTCTNSTQ